MLGLITEKSHCPYCGESIELVVDTSITQQEYIEDCQVCCRPMIISADIETNGEVCLAIRSENEAF
jgi:hypothetical protein